MPWEQRRAALQAQSQFQLKGRIAVAAGNDGFSAGLFWKQQGARAALALDGPLGVGGARVVADGPTLTVTTSRGEVLGSDAARAELGARLGFDPPLESLRYWVRGVPDPDSPATETLDAATQRLAALTQDGWQIEYTEYMSAPGGELPHRLSLRRGGVRVRLVVESWQA
jgi:outer membrane lipoprotein LolB